MRDTTQKCALAALLNQKQFSLKNRDESVLLDIKFAQGKLADGSVLLDIEFAQGKLVATGATRAQLVLERDHDALSKSKLQAWCTILVNSGRCNQSLRSEYSGLDARRQCSS